MAIKLTANHFNRNDYKNHSEYRKSIEKHLKNVLKDKSVLNDSTGILIEFNKVGIEKMVSKIGDIKVFVLCNLWLTLKYAILNEKNADRLDRPDITNFLLFKTIVSINDINYEVWSYVRERKEGYFLYSLNIDIKKTLQS